MIKFKEKIFFAPIIGKAITSVGGKILSSDAANTVSGVANLASPVVGMGLQTKQTIDAEKQQKEMLRIEKQKALQEKRESQNRIKNNNELTKQAASNPMAAATAINGGPINGSPQNQAQEQMYSELGGFIHNVGEIAHDRGVGKRIMNGIVGGTIGVTGAYLIDKGIQRNIKKSGYQLLAPEETKEEKEARKKRRKKRILRTLGTGAALTAGTIAAKHNVFGSKVGEVVNKHINKNTLKTIGNTAKDSLKGQFITKNDKTGKLSPNWLGIGATALPMAAPIVRYALTKSQLEEQIDHSKKKDKDEEKEKERSYSIVSTVGSIIKKRKRGRPRKHPETEMYDWYTRYRTRNKNFSQIGNFVKFKAHKLKSDFRNFRKAPVKTILDVTSESKGGGGWEGVKEVGEKFMKAGYRNNNKTSQKLGRFIKNNPKTSLLASIGVGLGITKLGSIGARKMQKALIDNDPNAFRYARSGERFIPKDKNEEEND